MSKISSSLTTLYTRLNCHRGQKTSEKVTFSFDEQDGGVSVGGSFHLSDQRFFLFIFFFFRLDTNT